MRSTRECCNCQCEEQSKSSFDFSNSTKPKINHEIYMLKTDMIQEVQMSFYVKELREKEIRIKKQETIIKKYKENLGSLQLSFSELEEEKFKLMKLKERTEKYNLEKILSLQNEIKLLKDKKINGKIIKDGSNIHENIMNQITFEVGIQTLNEISPNTNLALNAFSTIEDNINSLSSHILHLETELKLEKSKNSGTNKAENDVSVILQELERERIEKNHEQKIYEAKLLKKESEIQKYNDEISNKNNELNIKVSEISQLNSKILKLEDSQRNYDYGKEFYNKLQNEFNTMKSDYERLCGEYEILKDENTDLKIEIQELEMQNNEKNLEEEENMRSTFEKLSLSLEEEAAKLKNQLESLEKEKNLIEKEKTSIIREYDDLMVSLDSLKKLNEDLSSENSKQAQKILVLLSEIENKNRRLDVMEKEGDIFEQEREKLKELLLKEEEAKNQKKALFHLEQEKNELNRQNESLKKDIQSLKSEISKERENNKYEKESLLTKVSEYKATIDVLEAELSNVRSKQFSIEKSLNEKSQSLISLTNEKTVLTKDLESLRRRTQPLQFENDKMRSTLDELEQNIKKFEGALPQLYNERDSLQNFVANVSSALKNVLLNSDNSYYSHRSDCQKEILENVFAIENVFKAEKKKLFVSEVENENTFILAIDRATNLL